MKKICQTFLLIISFIVVPAAGAQITRGNFQSSRLNTHFLESGNPQGDVILLVHGNVSSSVFWTALMERLPRQFHTIAIDLRGFGDSETKSVDATRGVRDWSDDIFAFLSEQGFIQNGKKVHLAGWSLGGGIVMQYAIDHCETVASMMLIDPVSPFGFGGTKGDEGTPNYADFAGSGGGGANPDFVQRLADQDTTTASPLSPLSVMRNFYFTPPFIAPNERELLAGMLKTAVGDGNYPGNTESSPNWPFVRPGTTGVLNAISPKYYNLSSFANIQNKFPVLWIHGENDTIVSDASLFDFGYLASIAAFDPAFQTLWPGSDIFPAQPMNSQIRSVLNQYQNNGGSFTEVIIAGASHGPLVEKPDEVMTHYSTLLNSVTSVNETPSENIPKDFQLEANFPNPFNPGTNIKFDIPKTSYVRLEVYNLLGQKVATLVDERLPSGNYQLTFDGTELTSGVYVYRLQAGSFSAIRKMLLIK